MHVKNTKPYIPQKDIDTILSRVEFFSDGTLGSENFALLVNSPEILYV